MRRAHFLSFRRRLETPPQGCPPWCWLRTCRPSTPWGEPHSKALGSVTAPLAATAVLVLVLLGTLFRQIGTRFGTPATSRWRSAPAKAAPSPSPRRTFLGTQSGSQKPWAEGLEPAALPKERATAAGSEKGWGVVSAAGLAKAKGAWWGVEWEVRLGAGTAQTLGP